MYQTTPPEHSGKLRVPGVPEKTATKNQPAGSTDPTFNRQDAPNVVEAVLTLRNPSAEGSRHWPWPQTKGGRLEGSSWIYTHRQPDDLWLVD